MVATKRTLKPAPAADIEALGMIETELAVLARTLEGMRRRSDIHGDLDRASYLLARTLDADGPASINALAARLNLDVTTVSRQVNAMENAGLVQRRRDPLDGRVSNIELSTQGKRRITDVRAARAERVDRLLVNWSETDRRTFGKLLAKLNAAIRTKGTPGASTEVQ